MANFTGKLLQNYKYLECGIFRILLKHEIDHLSVLFSICLTYVWFFLDWSHNLATKGAAIHSALWKEKCSEEVNNFFEKYLSK